jgi:hypothetical protein
MFSFASLRSTRCVAPSRDPARMTVAGIPGGAASALAPGKKWQGVVDTGKNRD